MRHRPCSQLLRSENHVGHISRWYTTLTAVQIPTYVSRPSFGGCQSFMRSSVRSIRRRGVCWRAELGFSTPRSGVPCWEIYYWRFFKQNEDELVSSLILPSCNATMCVCPCMLILTSIDTSKSRWTTSAYSPSRSTLHRHFPRPAYGQIPHLRSIYISQHVLSSQEHRPTSKIKTRRADFHCESLERRYGNTRNFSGLCILSSRCSGMGSGQGNRCEVWN